MATSPKAFLVELYEEYLEEASFLYEQRRTLFHNPEITWKKIGEFEERLEAHLDGLVVGDKLALNICSKHAAEGDFGELYAAVCVFCRQDRLDLVLAAFDQLDPDDAEKANALTDALKHELPDRWTSDMLIMLSNGDLKLTPILAQALGYRRVPSGPQLLDAMRRCSSSALPHVVWALGRIRYEPAKEPIFEYLKTEEEPVRRAASIALARMGDPRAIDYCMDNVGANAWPISCLGLAGGRRAIPVLTDLAEKGGCEDCLLTLGFHGDPVSTPVLISRLDQPACAAEAATALQCITGAGLFETVFIPDEVDEDELFESERESFKPGKPLLRGDGKPFGSTVTRLSQKADDWKRWFQKSSSDLSPGVRHLNGRPITPGQLLATLLEDRSPHVLRKNASEELAIRYGCDFGFEADLPVRRQLNLLERAAEWARLADTKFQAGAWYFAGSVQRY